VGGRYCIVVPFTDDDACVKDGEVRVHLGLSPGHIFYDQPGRSTSTIPRTTPVPTVDSNTVPVSSTRSDQDSGRREDGLECPWTLSALPGQRIRLRIIVIDPSDHPVMDSESHGILASPDTCPWILIIQDSALITAVQLPICSGRQRDSQIYISIGHRLSIHVERSRVSMERFPTSSARTRRSGFLVTYECK